MKRKNNSPRKNTPNPKGFSAATGAAGRGVYLTVNGDEWEIIQGMDGLAVYPDDGEAFEDPDGEFVAVIPSHRLIITSGCFNNESLGTAVLRAIECSDTAAAEQKLERNAAGAGNGNGEA